MELRASVSTDAEIKQAWDDVEEAMNDAQRNFPSDVGQPVLDRNVLDQDAVVLGIIGGETQSQIRVVREVEDRLLATSLVASVNRFADPGETVRIDVDEEKLRKLGISFLDLASRLQSANRNIPAGSIALGNKKVTLKTNASFDSISDIENFSIDLPSGGNTLLKKFAKVSKNIDQPRDRLFRFDGVDGISLGVVPQENIDLIEFGKNVRKTLSDYDPQDPNIQIQAASFQPDNVSSRLYELMGSLFAGMVIIIFILFALMGLRVALVATFMVPAVTLVSLSFYSFSGGVLHQIFDFCFCGSVRTFS